jgi:hypothetical protein
MKDTTGSLAAPQYMIALDLGLEDGSLCERCLEIPRDFSQEVKGNVILKIDQMIEEWEASSCKMCRLLRFAAESQEPWSMVKLDLIWFPYRQLDALFRHRIHARSPNAIGVLEIYNRNSRRFTEDKLELIRCSEDNVEQPDHEQRRPSIDFQLLKRWLSNCDTKHRLCSSQTIPGY